MNGNYHKTKRIRQSVFVAVAGKKILTTYKTKLGVGRKSVTIGPYRFATELPQFAVIVGADVNVFSDADAATRFFIEYVGHADALNALHGRGRKRPGGSKNASN